MKMPSRRLIICLALVLMIPVFFFLMHVYPGQTAHSPQAALAPYRAYLQAHDIAPEDVLSYALIESDGKTTLQLTLQSAGERTRLVSISVQSPDAR